MDVGAGIIDGRSEALGAARGPIQRPNRIPHLGRARWAIHSGTWLISPSTGFYLGSEDVSRGRTTYSALRKRAL